MGRWPPRCCTGTGRQRRTTLHGSCKRRTSPQWQGKCEDSSTPPGLGQSHAPERASTTIQFLRNAVVTPELHASHGTGFSQMYALDLICPTSSSASPGPSRHAFLLANGDSLSCDPLVLPAASPSGDGLSKVIMTDSACSLYYRGPPVWG